MPVRDLLLAGTILAGVPFCFLYPWVGVLMWSWLAYGNPHRLTWDFAFEFPFAQVVAIATLVGFLFTRDKRPFVWTREYLVVVLLWAWFGVSSVLAMYPEAAWDKFLEFSKILVMAMLVVPLFQDRKRLRIFVFVVGASLGFYGIKGGLFVLATGGSWMVLGPRESFFESNTELALVLNMALPILFYLAKEETRRWLRLTLRAAFVLTILAVPFTYSRGGVLGLVVVLAVLFVKARRRFLFIPVLALALVGFMLFAPERWVERMQTMEDYQADESANLRFMSWRVAMLIAADRPLYGGGFRVFVNRATYDIYMPEYPRGFGHDAHSIYFNLLGEHGWVGLGLFVLLVTLAMFKLYAIRRLARGRPELAWAAGYAHMIQASLATYLITGAFLSAAYFDLAYQLLILVPVIHTLAVRQVAEEAPATAPAAAPGVTPVPVRAPRTV
jgi:probable O-glycosylation ligase (exosortase A-associated)